MSVRWCRTREWRDDGDLDLGQIKLPSGTIYRQNARTAKGEEVWETRGRWLNGDHDEGFSPRQTQSQHPLRWQWPLGLPILKVRLATWPITQKSKFIEVIKTAVPDAMHHINDPRFNEVKNVSWDQYLEARGFDALSRSNSSEYWTRWLRWLRFYDPRTPWNSHQQQDLNLISIRFFFFSISFAFNFELHIRILHSLHVTWSRESKKWIYFTRPDLERRRLRVHWLLFTGNQPWSRNLPRSVFISWKLLEHNINGQTWDDIESLGETFSDSFESTTTTITTPADWNSSFSSADVPANTLLFLSTLTPATCGHVQTWNPSDSGVNGCICFIALI